MDDPLLGAKPSISFLTEDTDPQLSARTTAILQALKCKTNFPTPTPTLAAVGAGLTAFNDALAAAVGGGVALTLAKNEALVALVALVALLRELSAYVQLACNGDLAKLLTSGFPTQKNGRTPVGTLPAPTVSVRLGVRSGDLAAKAEPLYGASTYQWRVSLASSPGTPVQTALTTAASNAFTGLTPGVVYQITASAVGASGPSDWSDPATQMVV